MEWRKRPSEQFEADEVCGQGRRPLLPYILLPLPFHSSPQGTIITAGRRGRTPWEGEEPAMKPRVCELCSGEAALYCGSDSAFLCRACDARVHQANFLAARHLRSPLCSLCRYDPSSPASRLCTACSARSDAGRGSGDDDDSSTASSSSSSCVSTTESAAGSTSADGKRRRRKEKRIEGVDARAREMVETWCRRVHASGAAEIASHALDLGLRRLGGGAVPIRVLAAAAVWFAAKLCCGGRQRAGMAAVLGRVGACSGVPAGVVIAAERRLTRVIRDCRVKKVEEGWAECP